MMLLKEERLGTFKDIPSLLLPQQPLSAGMRNGMFCGASGEPHRLECLRLKPDKAVGKLVTNWTQCERLIESFQDDGKKLLIIDGVNKGSRIWQALIGS